MAPLKIVEVCNGSSSIAVFTSNRTCVVGKRQGWENGESNMEALLYTLEANLT